MMAASGAGVTAWGSSGLSAPVLIGGEAVSLVAVAEVQQRTPAPSMGKTLHLLPGERKHESWRARQEQTGVWAPSEEDGGMQGGGRRRSCFRVPGRLSHAATRGDGSCLSGAP